MADRYTTFGINWNKKYEIDTDNDLGIKKIIIFCSVADPDPVILGSPWSGSGKKPDPVPLVSDLCESTFLDIKYCVKHSFGKIIFNL